MWIASSEVRSRPTFRYKRRPKYERWSTSRPQKRSGSKSSVLARVDEVIEMKRRDFISLLGGAAATWPLAARAQQGERMRRIGVLLSLEESDPEGKAQLSGFTQGLAELGWIQGRNLRMEVRWGGGDVDRIRTFAKDLVALQPDVIVAQGTPATAALQRETRTIPIVFVVVTDPVGDGFVAGLPTQAGISPAS